jgi:hypothetical protein
MRTDEFNNRLEALKLTINDVCALIHMRTDVAINPQTIRNALDRGTLSKPMSAAVVLLFKDLEGQHG